jgi:hypothetical protein
VGVGAGGCPEIAEINMSKDVRLVFVAFMKSCYVFRVTLT